MLDSIHKALRTREVYECNVRYGDFQYCNKLSNNIICKTHKNLKAIECDKYHFTRHTSKLASDAIIRESVGDYDTVDGLLSLIELRQRAAFRYKYNIIPDIGHSRWEEHLEEKCDQFVLHNHRIYSYGDEELDVLDNNHDEDTDTEEDLIEDLRGFVPPDSVSFQSESTWSIERVNLEE